MSQRPKRTQVSRIRLADDEENIRRKPLRQASIVPVITVNNATPLMRITAFSVTKISHSFVTSSGERLASNA